MSWTGSSDSYEFRSFESSRGVYSVEFMPEWWWWGQNKTPTIKYLLARASVWSSGDNLIAIRARVTAGSAAVLHDP